MTFSTDLVRQELAALGEFDGAVVGEFTAHQLHEVSNTLGNARRSLDALVIMIAGEVAKRSAPELGVDGLSRREGFSTPQEMLSKTLGTSQYDAKRMIDVGKSLDEHVDVLAPGAGESPAPVVEAPKFPHLTAAMSSGSLGVDAAAEISRTLNILEPTLFANFLKEHDQKDSAKVTALEELRELEKRLVDKAQQLTVRELRRVCERERAWHSPRDLVERERRQREARELYFGKDTQDMIVMTAKMDAVAAAPIKAWFEAQTRHAFQQRRQDSDADGSDMVASRIPGYDQLSPEERDRIHQDFLADDRTAGQIRLDALVSLALHGLDCESPTSGVKTTVVLRASADDLSNDLALAECDQVEGPISMGTLRAMAVDAEVIPVVMGGQSMPLDIGRADRYFTRYQRIAMTERDGGCSWCHAPPSFCQAHHISWWAKGNGKTDLGNGVLLCVRCHHRVHRDNWGIEVRGNEVWFLPPPFDGRPQPPRVGGKAHLELGD